MSDYLERSAELFDANLKVLLSMYNRGQFEFLVARRSDGLLLTAERKDPRIRDKSPDPAAGCVWVDLRAASVELRELADNLTSAYGDLRLYAEDRLYVDKTNRIWAKWGGAGNMLKGLLRARVLYYEIQDYNLSLGKNDSSFLIDFAERMAKKGLARCVSEQLERTIKLKIKPGDELYGAASKEYCLFAMFGIQSLIRRHEFERGLSLLDVIEELIRGDLRSTHGKPSYGLQGLALYLRARLYFGLGLLADARQAAIESTRNYALTIEQLERKRLRGDLREENIDELHLLSIRRSALTTSIGSAHVSILIGRIEEALKLLALCRAVLTLDCGELYARYVDVLWAEGMRALHSDKPPELRAAAQVLYRSRKTFGRLIPHSHYFGRSSVELALVYFYLARYYDRAADADETNRRRCRIYFTRAERYASEVIQIAEDMRGSRQRNPRLLANGYDVRSRLLAFMPEPDFEAALRDAEAAEKCAGEMRQVRCEALIAAGTALVRKAEHLLKRGKREELFETKKMAEKKLKEALELNNNNSPRIRAVALLRLAQAALLLPPTYPDARLYLREYKETADKVEHAFVKELADEVMKMERDAEKFFYADTTETWSATTFRNRLEEYLVDEFINELVNVIGGEPPTEGKRSVNIVRKSNINVEYPRRRGPKPTVVSFLANNLEANLDLHRNKAWEYARKKEKDFLTKCKIVLERSKRDN